MNLHKLQRFCSGLAGLSILSTIALIAAAFASGSIAQKDKFADLAAATGVLFATSAVAAIELSDFQVGK